jgi:hypothetical protein
MSGESKSADEMDNPMDGASGGRVGAIQRDKIFSPSMESLLHFLPIIAKGMVR